jgi:Ala-tRNA(Pro) deacylase
MAIAMTLRQYLDGRAVSYDVLAHRPTATSARTAEASHVSGDCLAKAVLLKGESGYLLAVVPASCQVEIDAVAALLDRRVELATEGDIQLLFADCDRGAIPPLGSAYGVETVIDERLERPDQIYFEGGDHESLVHLTQQQFNGLTWDAYHGQIARRT